MRVILFQPQFAEAVSEGRKRQTIRQKARCAAGDELSLRAWTGLPYRSKQRELCCRPRCLSVSTVKICHEVVWICGEAIVTAEALNTFAQADGFPDWPTMRNWFAKTHDLPFEGELITW